MNKRVLGLVCLVAGVLAAAEPISCDVCVVGGGSGGFAAALAAAREGAKVVVVEKQGILGGTSTAGMVCSWGGGPGDSTARELYDLLKARGDAIMSTFKGKIPAHCILPDESKTYADSLRHTTTGVRGKVNVTYEPKAMATVMRELLQAHGVTVLFNTSFTGAEVAGKRVTRITAESGGEKRQIAAKVFIDATGDIHLARDIGCRTEIGEDLNGITLCYRVTPGKDTDPEILEAKPLKRVSSNHQLPNGDRRLNMLPTVPGTYLREHGYEKTMAHCRRLVRRHWAFMRRQRGTGWNTYRFAGEAEMLGIREGPRIIAEYTLTKKDLIAGYYAQSHQDMIALAEHPADFHGGHGGELPKVKPYGIPYRCMIPRGWDNLLVACRGAGFDRVAASSARLQRTLMWMGHAAGIGAARAAKGDTPVGDVDVGAIVEAVGMDRASVDAMLGKAPAAGARAARPTIIGEKKQAFLCTDNGLGKVFKFDAAGKIIWEYPAPRCQDVWVLKNGNILFTSFTTGKSITGSVTEVTPDKQVVFTVDYPGEIHGCQRLPDGNTLLGVCGINVLVLVDPDGKELKRMALPKGHKNAHYHMRLVRMTPTGTLLVAHPKDGLVREFAADWSGKVVRRFTQNKAPFVGVRLKNGNTLICGRYGVVEVDKQGTEVWRLMGDEVPAINFKWGSGVQRLPNGNTVICNWLGHGQAGKGVPLFEVTPEKEIVWQYTDAETTLRISNVFVLTDPPNAER